MDVTEPSKRKTMTEVQLNNEDQVMMISHKNKNQRRRCIFIIGAFLFLILLLFIVALVLALTVFKAKEPRAQLLSATLQGIASRVSFPAIHIKLNVTLDLKLLVENRNHANFKHEQGKSLLLYEGKQVGETDIYPGLIPATGSATIPCRLTLELDQLASKFTALIGDVMAGQLSMQTITRIPGKVSFLGFIKKHVVAVSNCQITFGVRDMKIRSQICKTKAKT